MTALTRLQKWQRNGIFEAIQAVGLDPREFDLEDSDTAVTIKHKWSESCFCIGGDARRYIGTYVVGDTPAWPYEAYSWQNVVSRVSGWLEDVKRDLDTPDLWAELQRETELLGIGSVEVTENTPFTLAEQKEIEERLRERARYVSLTYSLSGAQIQALDAKLDDLVEASRRVGRKDWLNIFVGTIAVYILTAAVPPESARGILMTLVRAIGILYPELPTG